ncbi:hypothetical protein ACP4OV_016005 [Aristida adscensionis]
MRRHHHTLGYCLALATTLAALLQAPPLAAALLAPTCNYTGGNFTANSAYGANIQRLADTLPANASSSPALFAAGAAGAAPDAVYALALCRGDANASSCAACVAAAFRDARLFCALQKGAALYGDDCALRYAGWDFPAYNPDHLGPLSIAWNADNVSAAEAPALDAASGRLVNATADLAAADPVRRFATGEMPFDETYPRIYSLAQCAPVMTPAECRECLGKIIRQSSVYVDGRHGGRVLAIPCNFRFETYPFFSGRPLLQLPAPAPAPVKVNMTQPAPMGQGTVRNRKQKVLVIAVPSAAALLALSTVACFWFWRRRTPAIKASASLLLPYSANPYDIQSIDSLLLDISTLRAATDNFSEANKLGKGGFGTVYRSQGVLAEGQEIAAKRLSHASRQGVEELKTELVLLAKLQHKNLVRLIGVCLEEDEKLLVYEYMPNKSLDKILFDSKKCKELDWEKRLKIVNGVARGLQYLHEESQQIIIHRDLKPSNVLLDFDYNPKISDFGLAKLFDTDQSQVVTRHIAGTYGYMAPEYAMRGQYSVKSDVFSLGVLLLEIVTGRKNSSFTNFNQSHDLLSLVWEHWTTGKVADIVDPFLRSRAPQDQILKLVNIGLLCVQDSPVNRPMMSSVNVMLRGSVSLPAPSRPTFTVETEAEDSSAPRATIMSPNELSLTELEPR